MLIAKFVLLDTSLAGLAGAGDSINNATGITTISARSFSASLSLALAFLHVAAACISV